MIKLWDRVQAPKIRSKIDLKSCNNLNQTGGRDLLKSIFWKRYNYYKYMIILFIIGNIHVIFQQKMNNILKYVINEEVIL
jgi:hypothetical protein